MLRSQVLASLQRNVNVRANVPPPPDANHNNVSKAEQANILFMELLSHNKFMLFRSLWWWSIGERSNFLIRRLSLQCIAQATVMNDFAQFLWKLEPMPK
jgi:hypothetical protein